MNRTIIAQHIDLVDDISMYLENSSSGERVSLTNQEYETLLILAESPGISFTRRDLALRFWGANWIKEREELDPDYDVQSSIGARIHKARSKLDKISPGLGKKIKTIKGYAETYFTFDAEIIPLQSGIEPDQRVAAIVDPNTVVPMECWQLLNTTMPESEKKYDAEAIALALQKNDLKLYPGLSQFPQLAGDYVRIWSKHLSARPESFKYLVSGNNEIVGNFSCVALSQKQAEACLSGKLLEESFDIGRTESLTTAGIKDVLYILNFNVNNEYATLRNKNLLKQLFFSTLLSYAENDIYFRRIIINLFDAAQYAEFKQWGFSELDKRPNINYGRLFSIDMIPYPDVLFSALSKNRMLKEINIKLKEIYNEL